MNNKIQFTNKEIILGLNKMVKKGFLKKIRTKAGDVWIDSNIVKKLLKQGKNRNEIKKILNKKRVEK